MANRSDSPHPAPATRSRLGLLTLGALGVVYGDIGTSPLYAIRECFHGPHALAVTRANVLGILSLVFWTLVVVVTLKYLVYVLRADNRGEGGILALMALVRTRTGAARRGLVVTLGLFGAALLYADGVLTPAISVLSAVEGLTVKAPALAAYVVPATIGILIGLFLFQRHGTAGIGAVFGPVMVLWFVTLAILGGFGIALRPEVLVAIDPRHAIDFFAANGLAGFLILGAVFLVATGGEALYADLGHFGPRPIRRGWFALAGGALLANYFGQGALLLERPEAAANPFYRLAPAWALLPLLALATAATVIASQAIISGAFSLTRQAVQLGYLPRLEIVHTSSTEIGQIYVPAVNWALLVGTLALVVGFQTSSAVAAAYGVALTTTMVITTLLAHVVARRIWGWPAWAAAAVTGVLLVPDLAFFGAAAAKIPDGGWLPLVLSAAILLVMTSWNRGREVLGGEIGARLVPVESLIADLDRPGIWRVDGTAVYLTSDPHGAPIALLHNLKINRVVHRRNVFLTVQVEEIPRVPPERRLETVELGAGFARMIVRFGFMDDADLPAVIEQARRQGFDLGPGEPTYVLSRTQIGAARPSRLVVWRRAIFRFLSNNALPADSYFGIPPNRVVELGMEVAI